MTQVEGHSQSSGRREIVMPRSRDMWDDLYPIPPYFTDLSRFSEGITSPERLTGLPIETRSMRTVLRQMLTAMLKGGITWAALYIDADKLKTANERLGRGVGDFYIRWAASKVTNAFTDEQFSAPTEKLAVHHGGDEFVLWLYDIQPGNVSKIRKIVRQIEKPWRLQGTEFDFSLSTNLVTSHDHKILPSMARTMSWLAGNPERMANNFYNKIERMCTKKVKAKKEEKAQRATRREVIESLRKTSTPPELVDRLAHLASDQRLTPKQLKAYFMGVVMRTVAYCLNNPGFINSINPQDLVPRRRFSEIEGVYENIFSLDSAKPERPDDIDDSLGSDTEGSDDDISLYNNVV